MEFLPCEPNSDLPDPSDAQYDDVVAAGSGEPNPTDDGWINHQRPITRPILLYVSGCYGSAGGGGGKSLTVIQGKRKAQSFSPSRPLVGPIDDSDGKASSPHATPNANKLRSDGLSDCVTLQDLKDRFQLILDRDDAAATAVAEADIESDEADIESDVYSPMYFPWPMTNKRWEASKAEVPIPNLAQSFQFLHYTRVLPNKQCKQHLAPLELLSSKVAGPGLIFLEHLSPYGES
ncbi:hypothetical protein SASPL_114813 [Salvia splendens]|uniref:Uncharacterized protein n=1 Tax=Salvia splendens TaxID=180675 RepID=A0A8X8Y1B5_SALSN|nr:hypothetical protein SASPL_114813 [Salvia splendens]